MITFPPEFVAVDKYPGYYWNTKDEKLYSIKVTGTLKPLQFRQQWNGVHGCYMQNSYGYAVSRKGRKSFLNVEVLKKLTPKRQKVPMWNQANLF